MMRDYDLATEAELSEAEQNFDLRMGLPEAIRTKLGMAEARFAGGVVMSMRHDPAGYWSKALGFGFATPITADLIHEVCSFFENEQTPMAVLQMSPHVLPDDWNEICAKAGLSESPPWVKLLCETGVACRRLAEMKDSPSPLRVAGVDQQDADTWGAVMMSVFQMPAEGLAQMMSSAVGRPGWHCFGAWDGDELVGTGMLYARHGIGRFLGGTTVPHARKRGAHTALLAARALAARDLGCRWLVAETRPESPGTHNPSLRNMYRMGFDALYERQNWLWRLNGR
ncbi:GNAT family N-acetyltransferase [Streptomyces sp. CA-106110]|uniref:GNAT family N-acetyltransferase n=1 Tax=Streptomyces sp. CA-106110 TaxID=3240044 RepID=UPI003D8FC04D